MDLKNADVRIDIFTSGSHNPLVRLTHLPTGLVTSDSSTRDTDKNKEIALNELKWRLSLREVQD